MAREWPLPLPRLRQSGDDTSSVQAHGRAVRPLDDAASGAGLAERLEMPALGYGGQRDGCLGHCKDVPDAFAGPATEWNVGRAGAVGPLREPAVRVEAFGIGIVVGLVVVQVRAEKNRVTRTEVVAGQRGRRGDLPGAEPAWRVQPQGFGEDPSGETKRGQVVIARRPTVQDGVDLGSDSPLDLRICAEQIERPRQGGRRGFDSAHEEGADVTAQFGYETHIRGWNNAANHFGWQSYLGSAPGSADVSALAAPARCEDLSGLPPAWMGVGSLDLFLDEDIAYADRLTEAGVACEQLVVDGAFHGFDLALPRAGVSQQFRAAQTKALANALS